MQGLQGIMVALRGLWLAFRVIAPRLLSAGIILLVGYAIGRLADILISGLLRKFIGLDKWVRKKGLMRELYGISPSRVIAGLVKWYIYFLFMGISAENIGSGFLMDSTRSFVRYSPRILASIFLIFIGLVVGALMKKQVMSSAVAGKSILGSLLKFGNMFVFTVFALSAMGVEAGLLVEITVIAVASVTILIGVAVGIAVGLVLKDELRPYIKSALREILEGESEKRNGEVENGLYPS